MAKHGDFHHPIHDLHKERWSPRAFSDRPVESAKLLSVLEAARWAASSYNEQPWSFFVATKDNPEQYEKILSCLVEANRSWAQAAPVLLVSVAHTEFTKNGKPNRHAYHDLGLAVGNLVNEATHLGLHVHQMAGFDGEQARALLKIPADYDPVAVIALGYLGDRSQLPDPLQEREAAPRSRKPLQDFVFSDLWEQPAPWLPKTS